MTKEELLTKRLREIQTVLFCVWMGVIILTMIINQEFRDMVFDIMASMFDHCMAYAADGVTCVTRGI